MTVDGPVVGVCGFGVMGAAVATRLRSGGLRVITNDPATRSGATRARAEAEGVEVASDLGALVTECDVLLSIMGSSAALGFAEELMGIAASTDLRHLVFAECNLISPDDVRRIAEALGARGVRVVDAGIVGQPPAGDAAPTVYASGPYAAEIAFLGAHGFDVRDLGLPIGAASALKVCSAAVWQGALALVSEVAVAAERQGVLDLLLADLELRQSLIHAWFLPALLEAVPRAARWTPDMDVVARTLGSVGADTHFHEAAGRHYARMSALGGRADLTVADVVTAMANQPETKEDGR